MVRLMGLLCSGEKQQLKNTPARVGRQEENCPFEQRLRLRCEHFLQNRQSAPQRGTRELSQFSHKTLAINRANLV